MTAVSPAQPDPKDNPCRQHRHHQPRHRRRAGALSGDDPEQIDAALDTAAAAQRAWAGEDFKVRGEILRTAAGLLRERDDELALLVTREMGKPLAEARAEVHKCAAGLEFYADHAHSFLADEVYETSADRSWVSYEPVGVVLAVMPWNFPLWQVFRFAAPALMAGNAALLKHSPNTTGAALACQDILSAAGLPDGLFTALLVAEPEVPATTERLIADPRVGAVTITGSERAGSAVGCDRRAGDQEVGARTRRVGPVRRARRRRPAPRRAPGGQGPVPQRRAELHLAEAVHRRTCRRRRVHRGWSIDETHALTVGDPEAPGTDVGPMARAICATAWPPRCGRSRRRRHRALRRARPRRSGRVLLPAHRAGRRQARYVGLRRRGVRPGRAIITVADTDEAVAVANDTPFGLGASVWSADVDAAVAVGRRITSGACFINALVASDARMPFGGTKRSGYGRELAGPGIREFVNIRTWWAMDEPAAQAPTLRVTHQPSTPHQQGVAP